MVIKEYNKAAQFQSTLRRTERPLVFLSNLIILYFNPRSDERSDLTVLFSPSPSVISIHAPTNGATYHDKDVNRLTFISIHAPTNGATNQLKNVEQGTEISIHAPTNGATFPV